MAESTPPSRSEPTQDPTQQPGGDPNIPFGPNAPSMPQYFMGYAVVFGLVIGFALALVLLMKLLR